MNDKRQNKEPSLFPTDKAIDEFDLDKEKNIQLGHSKKNQKGWDGEQDIEPELNKQNQNDEDNTNELSSKRYVSSKDVLNIENDSYESKDDGFSAQKSYARMSSAADSQHITLDGGALKGIEKLLDDLVKERKRDRRKGWLSKIFYAAIIVGALFFIFNKASVTEFSEPHTAVVKLNGIIMPETEASSDFVLKGLKDAFESANSKGVILQINSPGGSPVQSQEIYAGISRLKKQYQKPFYVVIGDVGASGGYYVAAASDTIYAAKASIIGSIGVRMDNFGVTGLMDKLGVESRTLTSGKFKAALDPYNPINEEAQAHVQSILDGVHQQFIDAVVEGRKGRLSGENDELFSGLFWNGEQANSLGLIDGFKSVSQVAGEDINAPKIVDYTQQLDYFTSLTKGIGVYMANQLAMLSINPSLK